jgi:hypothetical protein
MAVRHKLTLMCEYVLVDHADRPSFINEIANVRLESLPGAVPYLNFVTQLSGAEGKTIEISIEDPTKKNLMTAEKTEIQSADKNRIISKHQISESTTCIIVSPFVFNSEGIHHIVVRVNGKTIHKEPFGVFVAPRATGAENVQRTNSNRGKRK